MKNIFPKLALGAGLLVLLYSQFTLIVQNVRLKTDMEKNRELNSQMNLHCIQTIADMVESSGRMAEMPLLSVFDSIDSDAVLVCRVSEYHCVECVDYAIGKMTESIREEGLELPVLILGNYSNSTSLRVLKSKHKFNSSVQCVNMEQLPWPIDWHGAPYYFVMYRNGAADDFFTPQKTDKELTDLYFAKLNNRWNGE